MSPQEHVQRMMRFLRTEPSLQQALDEQLSCLANDLLYGEYNPDSGPRDYQYYVAFPAEKLDAMRSRYSLYYPLPVKE